MSRTSEDDMTKPAIEPTKAAAVRAHFEPRPYEPPRLTGKRALDQVTLFSTPSCVPGSPGCSIGHP